MTRKQIDSVLLHAVVIVAAMIVAFPIFWMLGQSLMTEKDIYQWPPRIIPTTLTLENYVSILLESPRDLPVARWLVNSLFVSVSTTMLVLAVTSLAAYGFARLAFPLRDKLFFFILAAMMIPAQTTVIPVYLMMRDLRMLDSYHALVWPNAANVFAVFMLRQFFMSIPRELEDAAYVDGCSKLMTFLRVVLPVAKSSMITLGILIFLGSWNDLFWPLIVLNRAEMRTLPVGLTVLIGQFWSHQGTVMASAAVASVPVLIVYIIFQRYILQGISITGMAGR